MSSTPRNTDPPLIQDIIGTAGELLVAYGWHLLTAVFVVAFVWRKYLAQRYHSWRENRSLLNTDPHVLASRMEAIEEARRRLQERYSDGVSQHEKDIKDKQEKRRQELLELTQNSQNKATINGSKGKSSPKFRDDSYNPLMGSPSTSSYRPKKKTCASGGCG